MPTNSWLESMDNVNGDKAIPAPKMDATKPPSLRVSRCMLLEPMHYDICALQSRVAVVYYRLHNTSSSFVSE